MATSYRPKPEIIPPEDEPEQIETELSESSALAVLNRTEVEMQMDFAKKYPRSISAFRKRVIDRCTVNEEVALQMTYALPRAGKQIVGPSVRFAEIVASSWGNAIAMTRVTGIEGNYIVAQGVFFDVENNFKFGKEVRRRIVDKDGRRFNEDMIQTTGNAAASIAYRNAVFGAVSKGDWGDLHEAVKATAMGKVETLGARRDAAIAFSAQMGIPADRVLNALEVKGVADITGEHLIVLKGWLKQIKDGEAKIDDIFGSKALDDAEAMMTELGWNAAKRDMNRSAYKGRSGEQLDYLRGELDKKRKSETAKAVDAGVAETHKEARDTATLKPEPAIKAEIKPAATTAAVAQKGDDW